MTTVLDPPALSTSEFDGGGTYFADLRRSLRPPVGHVIAFEVSQALPTVTPPIVSGARSICYTRYIRYIAGGSTTRMSRSSPARVTFVTSVTSVTSQGGLYHAGEPIISGTRYIIAAFLYVEQEEDTAGESSAEDVRRGAQQLRTDGAVTDENGLAVTYTFTNTYLDGYQQIGRAHV